MGESVADLDGHARDTLPARFAGGRGFFNLLKMSKESSFGAITIALYAG